jgi:hypothetical protein
MSETNIILSETKFIPVEISFHLGPIPEGRIERINTLLPVNVLEDEKENRLIEWIISQTKIFSVFSLDVDVLFGIKVDPKIKFPTYTGMLGPIHIYNFDSGAALRLFSQAKELFLPLKDHVPVPVEIMPSVPNKETLQAIDEAKNIATGLQTAEYPFKRMLNGIEDMIQDLGATEAPRVTPEMFKDNIASTEIVKYVTKTGQVLRWGIINCKNGFSVTGKPSVAASSANDRAEIGEKIAMENVEDSLWELMAYELKSKVARGEVK